MLLILDIFDGVPDRPEYPMDFQTLFAHRPVRNIPADLSRLKYSALDSSA